MNYELLATDGGARRGLLTLAHGVAPTPTFMPVGTYGTVKAMSPDELVGMGASVVLGNTFHLWLRPGLEVIAAHGGLHRFMGWNGPILTDSGGFQVFSLGVAFGTKMGKLAKVGGNTLSVTLPRDLVNGLKWQDRQKVVVKRKGKKLIISDWRTPGKARKK